MAQKKDALIVKPLKVELPMWGIRNAVERLAVLAPGETLGPELLPPDLAAGPAAEEMLESNLPYKEAVTQFKQRYVRRALAASGGNQTRAAEALGLRRSYLNRLIHGFDEDQGL